MTKKDKKDKLSKLIQKCKYLEDLGIKTKDYGTNFTTEDDKRLDKFLKEKEIYGFDSRETWCLNSIFAEWLYTRCKMFLEASDDNIDLTFYSFGFEGKNYTQKEAIEKIIEYTEYYILNKYSADPEKEKEAIQKLQKASRLWAEIIPAMWW